MSTETNKTYYKSLPERDGATTAAGENDVALPAGISRRRFLEAAGFALSAAAVSGCHRAPQTKALPFVDAPEGVVPGTTRQYASTCAGCPAGCGLLVQVRDGRPLKMEGMPEHPLSRGGLCAVGQALPLGLYDSHRLKQPLHRGKPARWRDVDASIMSTLEEIRADGGAVRVVTPTVNSPTLQATIDSFCQRFSDARHVTFETQDTSAIREAHERTHGVSVLPHYRLDRARVIVSLGADFLGTWISPVEFTAAWRSRRVPTESQPEMSYHVQFEGRMSLTGSNADRRYRVTPDEYGLVLSHLAVMLAEQAGQPLPETQLAEPPVSATELSDLAERLLERPRESIVLCDSRDVDVQVLVNFINHVLGNYGRTLDFDRPSRQRTGSGREIVELREDLETGRVAALFVAGTDLTHNLPDRDDWAKAIERVPLVVSFAEREDDFSALAHFVCPDHHPLEAWSDFEPVGGLVSLSQPTIAPLGDTRSVLESLIKWSGGEGSDYEILRAAWKERIHPRANPAKTGFVTFWDHAVHDGFVEVAPERVEVEEFRTGAVRLLGERSADEGTALVLYSKVGMPDSRHGHNAWLHELPDPITKVVWDNYACLSQKLAEELDALDGDIVRVEVGGASIELPAFVQPGQHDRVVAIALGYGVRGTDRFANVGPEWLHARPTVEKGQVVGTNAAPLIDVRDGVLRYDRQGVTVTKTGRHRELASTQDHDRIEVPPNVAPHGAAARDIIQETTLAAYRKNPAAGRPESHHIEAELWPEDHPKTGHWWGMVVDLNACTGCSACVVACQSENNISVVGYDEVRRKREMHWLRLDRYYSGEGDDLDVAHQPMMCQHCDHAPCETVCPVLATVHSDEGLNEQAYNRCVGTRYCANNCPFKVRRFNWFDYPRDDELQNLALNPDVTVRSKGVMEKCSMCVQRIEQARIAARREGRALADGDIQTACQQSCPSQAIVFGDMNDEESRVSQALDNPRNYHLLEEFNFQTSVAYQRMVRNRKDAQAKTPKQPETHHGE